MNDLMKSGKGKAEKYYSWPLNTTGIRGADHHAVEDPCVIFDSPKI